MFKPQKQLTTSQDQSEWHSARKQSTQTVSSEADWNNPKNTQADQNKMDVWNEEQLQNSEVAPIDNQLRDEFPCSECGVLITIVNLDSHMLLCPCSPPVKCPNCSVQIDGDKLQQHSVSCLPLETTISVPELNLMDFSDSWDQSVEWLLSQNPTSIPIPSSDNEHNLPVHSLFENDNTMSSTQPYQVMDDLPTGPQPEFVFESQSPPMADVEANLEGMWIRMEFGSENGATVFILSSNPLSDGDFSQFQTIISLLQLRLWSPVAEKGLTETQIKNIPKMAYTKQAEFMSDCCTICMNEFEEQQQIMHLPCKHIFGHECLTPWLKNSSSCPNCRASIRGAQSVPVPQEAPAEFHE